MKPSVETRLSETTRIMYAPVNFINVTPDILNEEAVEETQVHNMEMREHDMDMMDLKHMMMTNLGCFLIAIICASFLIPIAVFISSQIIEKCCRVTKKKKLNLKEVKPIKVTTVIEKKGKKIKFFHTMKRNQN